jgi:RND family efflux transporter MFP subunit
MIGNLIRTASSGRAALQRCVTAEPSGGSRASARRHLGDTTGGKRFEQEKQIPRRLQPARDDKENIQLERGPKGPLYPRSHRCAALLAAALLIAGLTACSGNKQHETSTPEIVHNVPLLVAEKTTVTDYVEATGTVRAAQSAQLASQVMGTITRVNVHEGDAVRRGEVLITIDEAQSKAADQSAAAGLQASQQSIAVADADYALAESTMKRYQMLYDKKSVSPQEYDEMKTRLAAAKARRDAAHADSAQAEAAVSEANTAVGFTKIRAPFDGLIIAKLADAGAMAAPGVPLLTLEDPSRFRLEANVDESQIGAVHLSTNVPVVIDSLGNQVITGKVVQIVPAADPSSRTFTVKIDLPSNPQIRSGLFGRARFPRGERESILVPQTALLHRGQLDAVYVVGRDEIARLRYVTLGKSSASDIEVLSGLESGERIVTQPDGRELSGKRVGVQ